MNPVSLPTPASPHRFAITVRGVVQGVGFRPFVYQTAHAFGLTGWVRNEADGVQIEAQGNESVLHEFIETLRNAHPPQSQITAVAFHDVPLREETDFQIVLSIGDATPGPTIPADLATCAECLAEIRDPSQRRYGYPFTNCTNCGPRWSIIEQLPYDRSRTSMASFAMCPECQAEYENPADRRFHAQPIACPRCGPTLQLVDLQTVRQVVLPSMGNAANLPRSAFDRAVQAIRDGQIVALKGLGGFQLLADASSDIAVARLRERKRRPDRPFAVMMPTLDAVQRYCEVSDAEAGVLTSHQSPIVLLRKLAAPSDDGVAPNVAPGNPYLGVMLPYTPLHHLLMAALVRPIVCTSGNLSEEPMAITTEDAIARLGAIADVLLTHSRPIVRPVDDSIVRVDAEEACVLRRARGYAPLPIAVASPAGTWQVNNLPQGDRPTILALGGHLKSTVALLLGSQAKDDAIPVVMSAHVGDLDSVLSMDVFRRAADDLVDFFDVRPNAVVCDLHPDYASSRHGETLASRWNVPLIRVQHHHAHVAACMAEHGLAGPVLGFSWDGTGYGPDGTIWGGEVLLCEGASYRRLAHLRPFSLAGGDVASREPRRSALGLLFEIFGMDLLGHASRLSNDLPTWFTENQLATLTSMLSHRLNTPSTSSMGRLFDGVAALCGLPPTISFEGQAAMALEFAADENHGEAYQFGISGRVQDLPNEPLVADWEPVIRSVLADRMAGVSVAKISARFHHALADLAAAIAQTILRQAMNLPYDAVPVVLTGGCFQNRLLTACVRARLSAAGFRVYTHSKVPPGDGGIALGQAVIALQQL